MKIGELLHRLVRREEPVTEVERPPASGGERRRDSDEKQQDDVDLIEARMRRLRRPTGDC